MYVNEADVDQIVHKLVNLNTLDTMMAPPYKYKENLRKTRNI